LAIINNIMVCPRGPEGIVWQLWYHSYDLRYGSVPMLIQSLTGKGLS